MKMAKIKLTVAQQAHLAAKTKVETLEIEKQRATSALDKAQKALWDAEIAVELDAPMSKAAYTLLMHLYDGNLGYDVKAAAAVHIGKRGFAVERTHEGLPVLDITIRGAAVAERLAAR